ncbi:phosphatase PAP2 family protein [Roseospirillum parvum]|uniref:PAP2 superfamily protein n=1 Tax=Roseospirillum parvum TaxID=83401 RepID=A0A1G7W6H3_9PROT|nr:phosphatase PAP2 family protein [Roseospirillum parvum]SDG67553.1 PAP2 superfamily protein [Roseospirillum parvum]
MVQSLYDLGRRLAPLAAFTRARPLLAWGLWAGGFSLLSFLVIDRPLARLVHDEIPCCLLTASQYLSPLGDATIWYLLAVGGWLYSQHRVTAAGGHAAMGTMVSARLAKWLDKARPTPEGEEPPPPPEHDEAAIARWRQHARSWVFMLANMLAAGILLHVIKLTVGRPRPKHLIDDGTYFGFEPFSGFNSFPSGHSQAIFSALIALAFMVPKYTKWLMGLAVLVALSRVGVSAHYLSDVVMGSYLAIAVAFALKTRFEAAGVPLALERHG